MDGNLKCTTNDGRPGGDDDERVLRTTCAEGEHAGDHGDVPQNRSGVGDEKLAVTVENAEAPSGPNEEAGAGKEDADKENGEFALFAVEAGSDGVNEPGSGENAEKDENGSAQGEKRCNGSGGLACFFLVVARQQVGINGNEGSREDTFAKKILQEIGDAEGGFENVGGIGVAEVVGEDTIADQSGVVKVAAGKSLSDAELLRLNWFVQGVDGSLPK